MPMYLTVSEGPRADRARPVLAICDQAIIAELLRAIGRKSESCSLAGQDQGSTLSELRMVSGGRPTKVVRANGR